jgi:hypothetical protein
MSEFKIEDKVKHIVTDNAYNITTAIENLGVLGVPLFWSYFTLNCYNNF